MMFHKLAKWHCPRVVDRSQYKADQRLMYERVDSTDNPKQQVESPAAMMRALQKFLLFHALTCLGLNGKMLSLTVFLQPASVLLTNFSSLFFSCFQHLGVKSYTGKLLHRTSCCIWPQCRPEEDITVEAPSSAKTLSSLLHTVMMSELSFILPK